MTENGVYVYAIIPAGAALPAGTAGVGSPRPHCDWPETGGSPPS